MGPTGGAEEAEEGQGQGAAGHTPLPALPVRGTLQGGVPLWAGGPLLRQVLRLWTRMSEPFQGLCLQGGLQDKSLSLPGFRYRLPFNTSLATFS